MREVDLDGESLTSEDVVAAAREGASVAVPEAARAGVRDSRARIEDVLDGDETVYGVNTGFGELVDERIDREDLGALQRNLLRSHASGIGEELPAEVVRAMLVARINALAKGYSGVREVVIDRLVALLNAGVHPVVPSRGSLGASGDLAPLAHASLVLLGEGVAQIEGERLAGDRALDRAGLEPIDLRPKEGLALINGTQLTTGIAALLVRDAERLVSAADAVGALTTEVTMSSTVPSHSALQDVRPHPGQAASARNVRRVTADSEIVEAHRNCDRVQDAYSLRCLPQVHGAVREAVDHLREATAVELNSATDNPLVFPRERVPDRASGTGSAGVLSGGNFHGEVLALRLDYLSDALTELGAIAERRVDRMLNPNVQEPHLPPFLSPESGLMSGYMIAQYSAAAQVTECRSTGSPSVDNTPVSGNQEDHVSMSASSALVAREAFGRVRTVVGIELLCAAQAAEFIDDSLAPGSGTGAVYEAVRERVPPLEADRPLTDEIETATDLVASGALLERVDGALDGEIE